MKTAPAISSTTIVDTEDIFSDDESDDNLEVEIVPTVTTLSPKGSPSKSSKPAKKGRLAKLSEQAGELDLDKILSSD